MKLRLSEMLSRTSTSDVSKPRKQIPWISSPLETKAVQSNHGTHEETKLNTQENVLVFDETRLHHTDSDTPTFKHHHEAPAIELFFDLFFVANLATFTANHEVDTGPTLASYCLFLSLMWSTWWQTSLFDVRFSSDSYFHRAFKLITFGIFTGFAIVGPIFDVGSAFQDAKAFRAMSLILMVSRLALAFQYATVLWYVRGYKKVFTPLLLHIAILLCSAVIFLGLTFSFKFKKEDGKYVYKDGQKVTVPSNSYAGWFVVMVVEAIAVVVVSSLWRVVSFKHTHLVERVGLLTLIVMGEGIIGMTKSVTYVAKYAAYTSGTTIGVVAAAVVLIYLLWVLYYDQIEHDRFGTIRQQIWALLHYPLHMAILLTVEGSTQLITWWIAMENLNYLNTNLLYDQTYHLDNSTNFASAVSETLDYFNAGFKKENIPDFTLNLTRIAELDIHNSEQYDETMVIINDIYASLVNWIFKIFGFKISDDLAKNAKDNVGKADAIFNAFSTVFLFFLIGAGCILIILAIMLWFGKNHKSRGEMASIFVRVAAGLGLALVSTSYYTSASGALITSPMMIPLVVIVYLIVIIVDNVLIRLSNRSKGEHATSPHVEEPQHRDLEESSVSIDREHGRAAE